MASTAIQLLATIVVMAQDHTSSMFQKNFQAGEFCFICISAQAAVGIQSRFKGLVKVAPLQDTRLRAVWRIGYGVSGVTYRV